MNNTARILLVEGKDDLHVITNIMMAYSVPDEFQIYDTNGVEQLLLRLPVQLKASKIEKVGIVLDADTDIEHRWHSVRGILTTFGYPNVPTVPSRLGTILSGTHYPDFGAWLMPNNSLPGILEDFVALLIPSDDLLLAHANTSIDTVPQRLFIENNRPKALIHTWLAWQADPGTPMGLAITKKYLDVGSPAALEFVNWVKALFLR
jgi:hypothetical protein